MLDGLRFDVLRFRRGAAIKNYFTRDDDDAERAALLRWALAEHEPDDHFQLGPGRFACGHAEGNVTLPDRVSIAGLGMDRTRLHSTVWSDQQGTAFVLQNTQLRDLTLACETHKANEDGRTVGFDARRASKGQPPLEPFHALLDRVRVQAGAWAVYNWNNNGNRLRMQDCEVFSGRQCISAMGSGSADSQHFEIVRCTLDVDARRSNDVGSTSNNVEGGLLAVCVKGGSVGVSDTVIRLRNRKLPTTKPGKWSFTPRTVGVTDRYFGRASSRARVYLSNVRCFADLAGADPAGHYDLEFHRVQWQNHHGHGSGPAGEWVVAGANSR